MTTQASMIFRGDARSLEASATSGAAAVTRVEQAGRRVGPTMAGASKEVDTFGKRVRSLGALTLGTLGAAELVKGIKESINAAGDLEKQQRKVIRVFGDTPHVLEAFEKTAAKAYGVSHLAALKAVTSTGALLTNLGITQKHAAGLSVGIVKLSSDIASFNGLPTAVVADRVNKALLGQTRGLKSLGIALSQTDVNAKALALGLVRPMKSADGLRAATDRVTVAERKYGLAVRDHGKTSKEALSAESALIAANKGHEKAVAGVTPKLTAQQQALATLALIYERSKKQQGDFGRNSDTLANQQKTLDAEFSNLSDRLGKDLTPAMKSFVEFMAGPGVSGAGRFLTTIEKDSRSLYSAVQPLAPVAHAAGDALVALNNAGALKGILAGTIAYQGLTRSISLGAAAVGSARGLIGGLVAPFRAVELAAAKTTTRLDTAGFTGKLITTTTAAEKGISPLRAFATNAGAVGIAAGIGVGLLVAFSSAEESIGQKARAAASDLQGLQDAQDRLRGGHLNLTRDQLAQGDAARALIGANRDLATAHDAAHQSFTDSPAGDRARAAALQDRTFKTRAAARAQNDYDQAHQNVVQDEEHLAKARNDVSTSTDTAVRKIEGLARANANLVRAQSGGATGRNISPAGFISAEAQKAQSLDRTTAAIRTQIKANQEIRPKSAAGFQAILDLINRTKQIPEKKTLSILLNDAASGKLRALQRQIAAIQGKTVTIVEQTRGTPFAQTNPLTGKPLATGGVVDRPTLAMVGEEAPLYPEFIIPTNPARRGRALDLISQMRSWVPGFAGGAGPSPGLARQEASAIAATPAKTSSAKSPTSRSHAAAKVDHRPPWLKAFQDGGNKLPGDDAYSNSIARAQANLDDASRTGVKSDDVQALHSLIKIANRRLPVLHSLRNTHRESIWQTAVNTEISSVTGQLAGYRSTLTDTVHKPGPDDVTVSVPSNIRWAIEKAGFTDSPGDDIRAQHAKAAWISKQLSAKDRKGRHKLTGAARIAYARELARTNAELSTLGSQAAQAAKDAADSAAADAATAPEIPGDIQEALANAALTPDTADDLTALQAEQSFLQDAIANETNQSARIALKQELAGVNDQIASITSAGATAAGGSTGTTGPTADQQAQTTQAQAARDVALRGLAIAGQEIKGFGSSGDIGTSRFGNAYDAARGGPTLAILGDFRSLQAVGAAAVQGMGAQPSVSANRVSFGVS